MSTLVLLPMFAGVFLAGGVVFYAAGRASGYRAGKRAAAEESRLLSGLVAKRSVRLADTRSGYRGNHRLTWRLRVQRWRTGPVVVEPVVATSVAERGPITEEFERIVAGVWEADGAEVLIGRPPEMAVQR